MKTPLAGLVLLSLALPLATADTPRIVPWKPHNISSPQFESHAAFDPVTGDLYFVRSSPQFRGWRILVSRPTTQGWSEPEAPSFAGDGVEADPFFTADGRTLYFISNRSTDGVHRKDLDLWRVDRNADGTWQQPTRLPEPLNSTSTEWFPRPAPDGWFYFGSNRPGGFGGNDIWRGHPQPDGHWVVENLGAAINSAADEFEPLPSPDGSRLIIMAADGLYQSRRDARGWRPKEKLGDGANADGMEVGAVFSPSGRSLLFSRDTGAADSGEFFVLHESDGESWPPSGRISDSAKRAAQR
ncbi:TolB family protein [Opitutus terrae]|uniref:WD40 domain protein beta Propeller n=1 Tax=Opitutus terrae (strain DSM 11246 / JCM 15787 / PB90-1) TaxID=452637 RepID=B1ZSJ5_OPITP|nr:PD40 domain-containing protein [Opitutus terrae]ACB73852.1 WD40 domain protein beta Propeller [Opitutus terrae PB90-1]